MPTLVTFRKALAAVVMTVGALGGGAIASAEQQGSLSIVEIVADKPIRPDTRRRALEHVRKRLDGTGSDNVMVGEADGGTVAVWISGSEILDLEQRLEPSDIGFHTVDADAGPAEGEARKGFKLVPDANENRVWAISNEPLIGADGVADAEAGFDYGPPHVVFRFTDDAGKRFGAWTTKNVGASFAIVYKGEVISAPVIREPILGGSGQISGIFTVASAVEFAGRMVPAPDGVRYRIVQTCQAARPRAPPAFFPNWKIDAACP